jgi:hypothetical protein
MMKALTLTFALLLICTGAALAQTPDGETPAEETVCDSETGAAYGLCNAYCEAMDCESESPNASETACTKVRDKFMNITGRDLPCEAPDLICACQIIPEFNAILNSTVEFCSIRDIFVVVNTAAGRVSANVTSLNGGAACAVGSFVLELTDAEAAACMEYLREYCAASDPCAGVVCPTPTNECKESFCSGGACLEKNAREFDSCTCGPGGFTCHCENGTCVDD